MDERGCYSVEYSAERTMLLWLEECSADIDRALLLLQYPRKISVNIERTVGRPRAGARVDRSQSECSRETRSTSSVQRNFTPPRRNGAVISSTLIV